MPVGFGVAPGHVWEGVCADALGIDWRGAAVGVSRVVASQSRGDW